MITLPSDPHSKPQDSKHPAGPRQQRGRLSSRKTYHLRRPLSWNLENLTCAVRFCTGRSPRSAVPQAIRTTRNLGTSSTSVTYPNLDLRILKAAAAAAAAAAMNYHTGATFVPGGDDSYYMPELIQPTPNRYAGRPETPPTPADTPQDT